jgi:hypothetical protein
VSGSRLGRKIQNGSQPPQCGCRNDRPIAKPRDLLSGSALALLSVQGVSPAGKLKVPCAQILARLGKPWFEVRPRSTRDQRAARFHLKIRSRKPSKTDSIFDIRGDKPRTDRTSRCVVTLSTWPMLFLGAVGDRGRVIRLAHCLRKSSDPNGDIDQQCAYADQQTRVIDLRRVPLIRSHNAPRKKQEEED